MLVVAVILVSISYMALRILSEVVVTPPTPLRELADQPRELIRLPGEKVIQLQVSPNRQSTQYLAVITFREDTGESFLRVYALELPGRPPRGYTNAPSRVPLSAVKGTGSTAQRPSR